MWQKQDSLTEGSVAVNTFGWKRREMVTLSQTAQDVPPATKKHKSTLTQTLQDQSQIGLYPSIEYIMRHKLIKLCMWINFACSNGKMCAFWTSSGRDVSATSSSNHHRGS